MTYSLALVPAFALVGLVMAPLPPSSAEIVRGGETYSVAIHHLHLPVRSMNAARSILSKIDAAALEVCGASSFSLREVKDGIRKSACWRNSLGDAVHRISDPLLTRAYDAQMTR